MKREREGSGGSEHGEGRTKRQNLHVHYEEDEDLSGRLLRRAFKDAVLPKVEDKEYVVMTAEEAKGMQEEGAKRCFDVSGRQVMVVYAGGQFHCVDALCGHLGRPLIEGDIEELHQSDTRFHIVKCAAHHKRFRFTGEEVDSSGAVIHHHGLRPHTVTVTDRGLSITLCVNASQGFHSDTYQHHCPSALTPDHSQLSTPGRSPSTPGQSAAFRDTPSFRARRAMARKMMSFSSPEADK